MTINYDNKELILEIAKKNYFAVDLSSIPKEFWNDKDFIKKILDTHVHKNDVFDYMSEELKNNREFILELIKENSNYFRYINEEFKSDKEIVTITIKDNINNFTLVSEELRNDKNLLLYVLIHARDDIDNYDYFHTSDLLGEIPKKLWDEINETFEREYANISN